LEVISARALEKAIAKVQDELNSGAAVLAKSLDGVTSAIMKMNELVIKLNPSNTSPSLHAFIKNVRTLVVDAEKCEWF